MKDIELLEPAVDSFMARPNSLLFRRISISVEAIVV
jgi:hypothetical protein